VKAMNVNISTEVTETKVISNANCKVTMLNGEITSIHVERADYVGGIEFETKFGEFEHFVQNLVDVYHAVRLEQIQQ